MGMGCGGGGRKYGERVTKEEEKTKKEKNRKERESKRRTTDPEGAGRTEAKSAARGAIR
jgi:hypothetical protein